VAATHGGVALLLGRRAYVFGGAGPPAYDLVQAYHPANGQTRVAGRLPGPRADLAAAAVGSRVVVAAGFDGVRPLDTVLTTTDERHFRLLARLPQAVRYPAVAVVARSVYLFGGLEAGGEYTGTFSRSIQRVNLLTGPGQDRRAAPHLLRARDSHRARRPGVPARRVHPGRCEQRDPSLRSRHRPRLHAGTLPEHVADGGVATIGDTTYILGGINGAPLTAVCVVRIN
jgi:hypothetical protein